MKRSAQRGSILLIAVLLGGLLAALSLSLLASAALESRGVAHADAARDARRLARSGVALAAAQRLEGTWAVARSTHALAPGTELVIDVDPERDPQVQVEARSASARCALAAEIAEDSALAAYALAVFDADSSISAPLRVGGSAYFAARERPFLGGALLDLEGDLDLAAMAGEVEGPRFAHVGRLRGSRRSADRPQVDFAALWEELERRGSYVQRLRGGGTLKDASVRGVLWVELGPEEELVCENLILDGALVVCPIGIEPKLLPTASRHGRLVLRGASELRSAAEILASVALAAPCTELGLGGEGRTLVRGLALVGAARDLHDLEVEGALWARGAVQALHRVRIALPEEWSLDLPEALRAPRELARMRIAWR